MRVSVGTHEECIKSLRSFGVPTYALPFDEQRRIDTKQVVSKWQKRKEMENQNQNQEATKLIVPGPFDVLIGKSYMCREHIGNIRYRSLVANRQTQYKNSPKEEVVYSYSTITFILDGQEQTIEFQKIQ